MTISEHQTQFRLADVLQETGLSVATVYRMIKAGTFPKPYKSAGRRGVHWAPDEIRAWVESERAVAR